MRLLYFSRAVKYCCLTMLFSACAFFCSAQLMARNMTRSKQVKVPQLATEVKISLKNAIELIKNKFDIKIAYKEGILENKLTNVSQSQIMSVADATTALTLSLNGLLLDFNKISDSQYVIVDTRSGNRADVIKGTVLSANDNTPLIGATVYIKGTKTGSSTDAQGQFSITIPANLKGQAIVLTIASVGYESLDLPVSDINAPVSIKLKESNSNLNEVVVTALGIKKESKSLGYAITEVKGSEFTQARENNIANALTGKVAGVNATGLSTGPGGSSRVIIRGNTSFNGNNQPLYVVNGMPIDNTVPGGSATTNGITTNVDRGDGISSINPDDIETITVLKGGAAAALYGSRASNGVILITTKKGVKQRGIGIDYNSTYTIENAINDNDYQYEYGQGLGGVKPLTKNDAIATGRLSFGAKIDGSDYVAADGLTHPYSAVTNNIQNFYSTGTNFTNTIAFSGGTDGIVYRLSLADLDSKGILSSTKFKRQTANLNINAKISDKIRVEGLAQYNLERGYGRTSAGDALGNPNWTPYEVANTVDVRWLAPGYDAAGNQTPWNDAGIATNGYFVMNKYVQNDTKNRFIGQGSITYDVVKNFSLKGVISRDFYNYDYVNILPTGDIYIPNGEYAAIKSDVSETNALLTGNYKTRIAQKFGISILGGANSRRFVNKQLNMNGSNFTIPYFYSYSNLATATTTPTTSRSRINSVFGSADFDYKSILFLTYTARNDWFSTLSPENNSILYQSLGGSFVVSDAFKLPSSIDIFRLKGSWAEVGGGEADPYKINLSYSNVPSSGLPLQNVTTNNITNPNLKPYTMTTYEGGFELKMFKGRLGLDFTAYTRKTTNDILNAAISSTSGYSNAVLNVGELQNKGIEFLLTGSPVSGEKFGWNISYNIAYNKSKVIKLVDGTNTFQVANSVGNWGYINQTVGSSYGTIVGTRMLRNAAGQIVYNSTTNRPVATGLQELGDGVPPLTMGLNQDFRFGNFTFSFLLDGKFGNKILSIKEVYATRLGLLKSTLPGRENGLTLTGVDQAGNPYSAVIPVSNLRAYYNDLRAYSELFVHDGSFIKLRQAILSYNIPVKDFKLVKIQSASLSFVARNILTLYKKTDNFDPESSFTNGNAQGFESIGLPRTRTFGMNLMVKF
ncbi:SusC/RagA family TonB-linked outer membrane protein [Pedobacter rhodius]|uniref:SusC/RagA family TonB-linked outer membrane protein n=1 Tax=Pedobacter rhodius TaxID=3004098 RepID=A0ABT4KW50_9SPHI|nr:SusC/RagA family TonB-linked outer membrane protein [Pedobacter sp. SJ11]MCZ4223146.1 SusC/RagA family TonB-linked outer membrane protein [Pedobacter sp. SJ11]